MSTEYPTPRRSKRQSAGVTADEYFAILPAPLIFDTAISDGAVRLYAVLRRHADDTGFSYPKRSTLAKMLRCSVDTVDRRITDLCSAGWLEVRPRFEDGVQIANGYHLRRPGRVDAAPPGRTDAAPPGRVDAAQNQSHLEPEPLELEASDDAHAEGLVAEQPRDQRNDPRADCEERAVENLKTAARGVANAVWEARPVKPKGGWIAVAKLAEKFIGAGVSPERLTAAMVSAATVSQGSVEVELSRAAQRPRNTSAGRWSEEQRSGPVRRGEWSDD